MLAVLGVMLLLAANYDDSPLAAQVNSPTPTETLEDEIPPSTPLPTLTPSNTLRPPPTFEPPTLTPAPSNTPAPTATSTIPVNIDIPPLHGLETATPSSTPGCEPREEWALIYEVQPNDALARIAQTYNTYVEELVAANCLTDANVIRVGQKLRVPGEAHPVKPLYECVAWEVITPIDRAYGISASGQLTFNWRGPKSPRNLIRVLKPDGTLFWERTIDLRQNETITLKAEGFEPGSYRWQVYPLNLDFVQIDCKESPLWTFDVVEW